MSLSKDKFDELQREIHMAIVEGSDPKVVLMGHRWINELRDIRGFNPYLNDPNRCDNLSFCGVRLVPVCDHDLIELVK